MQTNARVIASITCLAFFILIALASVGPDESSNTRVAIDDCESRPSISVKPTVTVFYELPDPFNHPHKNQAGTIYITHQKVNTDTCTYSIVFEKQIPFETDAVGRFMYTDPGMYPIDNKEDLFRVEVYFPGDILKRLKPVRKVEVLKYPSFQSVITVTNQPEI